MLVKYLVALGKYWWALMGSAAFTLFGIVAAAEKWSSERVAYGSVGLAFIMFFVASFLTWRDQRVALERYEARAPTITIKGPAGPQSGLGTFAIPVHVVNRGEDTSFNDDWRVTVRLADGRVIGPLPVVCSQGTYARILRGGQATMALASVFTREIPSLEALRGAKLIMTVSTVGHNSLRAEYPAA
jgi:drug/metabolite transporter superfamily protein YnfA